MIKKDIDGGNGKCFGISIINNIINRWIAVETGHALSKKQMIKMISMVVVGNASRFR